MRYLGIIRGDVGITYIYIYWDEMGSAIFVCPPVLQQYANKVLPVSPPNRGHLCLETTQCQ